MKANIITQIYRERFYLMTVYMKKIYMRILVDYL